MGNVWKIVNLISVLSEYISTTMKGTSQPVSQPTSRGCVRGFKRLSPSSSPSPGALLQAYVRRPVEALEVHSTCSFRGHHSFPLSHKMLSARFGFFAIFNIYPPPHLQDIILWHHHHVQHTHSSSGLLRASCSALVPFHPSQSVSSSAVGDGPPP